MADKYISQLPLATSVLASDHIITDNGTNTTRARVGSLSSVLSLNGSAALSASTADIQDYLLMYGNSPGLSGVELKITLSDLTALLENLINLSQIFDENYVVLDDTIFSESPTGNASVYYVNEDVSSFYTLFNGHSAYFTTHFNTSSYSDNYVTIQTSPALSSNISTLYVDDVAFILDPATDDMFSFYFQTTGSGVFACGKPGTGNWIRRKTDRRIPPPKPVVPKCPPPKVKKVKEKVKKVVENVGIDIYNYIVRELNDFTPYNNTAKDDVLDIIKTIIGWPTPFAALNAAKVISRGVQRVLNGTGITPELQTELEEKAGGYWPEIKENLDNLVEQYTPLSADFDVDPPATEEV